MVAVASWAFSSLWCRGVNVLHMFGSARAALRARTSDAVARGRALSCLLALRRAGPSGAKARAPPTARRSWRRRMSSASFGACTTRTLSQSMMQAACEQVLEAKNSEWCLAGKCQQPEVLAKRLRAACRHLSQAVMKDFKGDWVFGSRWRGRGKSRGQEGGLCLVRPGCGAGSC